MAGQRATSLMEVDSIEFRDGFKMALENYRATNRQQLVSVAARTRDVARSFCPVDTGWLKSSISYRKGEDQLGPFVEIGVLDVPPTKQAASRIEAFVGRVSGRTLGRVKSPREYGWYVEFGTIKMPAQPFLRPALAMVLGFMVEGTASASRTIAGQGGRLKHLKPRTFTVTGEAG